MGRSLDLWEGSAALDGDNGNAALDEIDRKGYSSFCHFLKQVDYFSLVYESKEDSC